MSDEGIEEPGGRVVQVRQLMQYRLQGLELRHLEHVIQPRTTHTATHEHQQTTAGVGQVHTVTTEVLR